MSRAAAWLLGPALCITAALGCATTGSDDYLDAPEIAEEPVAASVGEVRILRSEVAAYAAARRVSVAVARERLIELALLEVGARRAGTVVAPSALDARLTRWTARFETRQALKDALAASGRTLAMVRSDLLVELETDALLKHHGLVRLAGDAVAARYRRDNARFTRPEQVRVIHLFVRGPETAEQKARLATITRQLRRRRALRGRPDAFMAVARAFGDGRSSEAGGDLGWFARGAMEPDFERAVFAAKPGQLVRVRTRRGVHLARVVERRAARTAPLSEVSQAIADELRAEQRAKGWPVLLKRLRAEVGVSVGSAPPGKARGLQN